MSFIKKEGASTEYQGESFTKTLLKRDETVWTAEDEATYILKDRLGATVVTGALTKVNGDFGLKFEIGQTDTTTLLGNYLLLVYLTNTVNTDYADVIAEYTLVYNEAKAT